MNKLNAFLFAIACIFVMSSCKKDDEPTVSKTELLAGTSSKMWIQTAGKKNGTDYFSTSDNCNKDDILILRSDKTYEWNEGDTKCSPSSPQIFETGNWSLKSNESVITMNDGEARINELTATTLRVTYILDGDDYDQTYTAK